MIQIEITPMLVNPDTEPEITINPDTREITVPPELYNIAVVADDNAEMVKIRIPRYFDGEDFSLRNCTISFNNAAKHRGNYTVRNILIEEESIVLDWYISKFVTEKSGKIYFVVEFKKEIDNRGMSYSWSTLSAEMNVLPGLDDAIEIDERDISLYQSLLSHIQANDLRVANLMTKFEDLYQIQMSIELLTSQLTDLKSAFELVEDTTAYLESETLVEEG
ncbi:hypothetical protein [Kineothrix sedimenti]|uniref:BppU N-terminal domain-containing protein n=1 Tax=Kineothrix sedimenti TaxID=3123317 RepID=A0ABZ3F2C0_9FIRM